jgi:hypothetical protein
MEAEGAKINSSVVQKLQFVNNNRLKAAKCRAFLQDLRADRRLVENQPGS